jgi:hypothetical protein
MGADCTGNAFFGPAVGKGPCGEGRRRNYDCCADGKLLRPGLSLLVASRVNPFYSCGVVTEPELG